MDYLGEHASTLGLSGEKQCYVVSFHIVFVASLGDNKSSQRSARNSGINIFLRTRT